MKCLILAAGYATRLYPLTENFPKPLLKVGEKTILDWLDKWDIPYDEIIYGKPWPGHNGYYVDDRTVRPDEFLKRTPDELDEICKASRCKDR